MISNEELIQRIETLAQERGISKANALKESGVGKDFIANMKKGQKPALEKTVMLANYFNVSIDFLVDGRESFTYVAELHKYHWNHPADDPVSKKYNAVCRTVCLLAGKPKGYALLSAARVPADKPTSFTDAQLNFFAFLMNGKTNQILKVSIFDDEDLLEYEDYEFIKKYVPFEPDYSSRSELVSMYPETEKWFNDINKLYVEALLDEVDSRCFTETAEILSKYSSYEQGKIMALFKNAVKEYEKSTSADNEQSLSDTSAEIKGNVS